MNFLQFLTVNGMSILQFLTVIGSVVAFLVSALKYIDTRRIESKTKRFEQYRLVCVWLAGRTESGSVLVDIQQAVGAYQLADFPEYKWISLALIDYYLERYADLPPTDVFKRALIAVRTKLDPSK
jgi:hypothetical protein